MNTYSKFVIYLATLTLVVGSTLTASVAAAPLPIALLLGAVGLIQFGLSEKHDQVRLSIVTAVICLLIAVAAGWNEADSIKTFNDQNLRERLKTSIGPNATSDFFISVAQSIQFMSIIKVAAMFNMFILGIYSAFLTKNNLNP